MYYKLENVDDWQNINTLTSVAVGTPVAIENRGSMWFYLQISNTKPDIDSISGKEITSKNHSYAVGYVDSGDPIIWIRPAKYGTDIEFDLEEVV